MSWASRRRLVYAIGVFLFFATIITVPTVWWYLHIPETCNDGIQNQGEASVDRGGPCPLLDKNALSPVTIRWERSFNVRPAQGGGGVYDSVAYIYNPNAEAGAVDLPYHFGLYDEKNVLVAESDGVAYIMPGGVTPIFVGGIPTGNRSALHTKFEFTAPVTWQHMHSIANGIQISNQDFSRTASTTRVSAMVQNTSLDPIMQPLFIAIIYDTAENAIASSQTALQRLDPDQHEIITFTWPTGFTGIFGRIDILPLVRPALDPDTEQ